ncbi:hypothetical protein [Rhizobium sp. WYJ-E13]|uniref:hypothetical protein n=1 Tax=Rhizobium sp. WYJ-E13 TaxID=2849093 RepID=UPI001C1EEE6F|nr:hypothetical protein [Rhizobium sp. WYJ-E13]QWW70168.1 hypothetical protein KQ933_10930 [Rhizobium sp. WYJ-E13]
MDNMQDNNASSRKRDRQAAATASSIIQSSDENPDQVAEDKDLAVTYVRVTGNLAPPPQMLPGNRELLQGIIDAERNRRILALSPRTASWLRENPSAAMLAKDDIHNLSSFEEVAQRFGQVPKAFDDPAKEPVASSTNPETPPSTGPVSPAALQQAPASNAVRPDTAENVPSAAESGLSEDDRKKEELIAEIRNAKKLSPEEYEVLKEKVRTQPWFDAGTGTLYLDAVREGKTTDKEVNAVLNSKSTTVTTESGIQNFKELGKGTATGVVVGGGRIMEGSGQLINSSQSEAQKALMVEIARAASLSPHEVDLLRLKIDQQNILPRDLAQRVMSEVLAGDTVPDDVEQRFAPLLQGVSETLQSGGQRLADYGKTMLPAAPGYENSLGRQSGETFGQALIATGTTIALGPSSTAGIVGGLVVESLRAAGDGTAAAREAGLPEDKQTLAAMLYAPTALADLIPFGKAASSALKFLPISTVAQHLVKTIVKDGAAQTTQLVAQNTIKHFFIDPKQEILEKFKDTFVAGGFAGVGKELLIDLGEKLLLRKRGSAHNSASRPEAAIQDRQQFEEMATTAASSKFRQRDPEGHREHTAEVLKGTKVEHFYTSPERVDNYEKATGVDSFGLNGTPAMQVAKDTGSDLKIPTADYLAKSTPSKADADFRDSMRFGADALNHSEALASHIGVPAPGLNPRVKQNGPYIATGYVGNQKVDDYTVSHSRNADPTAKKMGRVANSGNTQRYPDGLRITSPHQQP